MEENELNFDKEIRNAKCIPGINYVAVEEDEKSLIILEVYYDKLFKERSKGY